MWTFKHTDVRRCIVTILGQIMFLQWVYFCKNKHAFAIYFETTNILKKYA